MGARKNTRILRSPPVCVKKRQFSKTSLGRTAAHNLPAVLDFISYVRSRSFSNVALGRHWWRSIFSSSSWQFSH